MNNLEIRFYSEPTMRDVPVTKQTEIKEMFYRILEDIKNENPYATVSDILSEEESYADEF